MRKFLFNASVVSALFGVIGVVQSTRRGPRDWRLVLAWVSWGLTVAIAIGTVVKESEELSELED